MTEEPATEPSTGQPAKRRHVGPLVALGLAAALAIAAVVVAIVGGDDVAPTAIRVNGTEVSQKTFNDELRKLAPTLREQQAGSGAPVTVNDASLPSQATAQLASLYVTTQLLQEELARRDVEVSATDRDAFIEANRAALGAYSPTTRDLIVDNSVFQDAFVGALGEEQAAAVFRRVARRADVHVDPRYGFWNAVRVQVCPPVGCAAQQPSAPSGG